MSCNRDSLVVGSEDRLRYRFVDRVVDATTKRITKDPIDLTSWTLTLIWQIDPGTGLGAVVTKTLTADADQVTNKGWAYYDLDAADLTSAGKLKLWVKGTDGAAKTHYSQPYWEKVIAPPA